MTSKAYCTYRFKESFHFVRGTGRSCHAEGLAEGDPWRSRLLEQDRQRYIAVSPLARIPDRFSQHGVKLALVEFLRLSHYWLARGHYPIHRAGTGRQQCWLSLRRRPYLGFCWSDRHGGLRPRASPQSHAKGTLS